MGDYARQLRLLLPPGVAFDLDSDTSETAKVIQALADELARIDARGVNLIDESDPRTTNETIPDWERMLSLPDTQVPVISAVLAERRFAVTQKYIARGGQDWSFFVNVAKACGYDLADGPLPTPVISSAVSGAGGGLTTGTYSYRVSALNERGETLASARATAVVIGVGKKNAITWGAVLGASSYNVYGRTNGTETYLTNVAAPTVTWDDTGAVTPGTAVVASTGTAVYPRHFAEVLLREGFRVDDRCYGSEWAYALQLNVLPPSGTALAHADFERIIRHVTHAHITDVFVYL